MPVSLKNASRTSVELVEEGDDGWPTDPTKYEFAEKGSIGKGAFAKVYIATCPSKTKKQVAIKLMDLEKVTVDLDHLRHEVSTMKLCKHPNVLPLYNCFTVKSMLWLVMPFMNHGSCLEVMKQLKQLNLTKSGEMDEATISAVLVGATKGLAYLHKSGWIHRDIKSGNILIDDEGNVMLADFGVAAITRKPGPQSESNKSGNDEIVYTFAGTPCWMAPEVMKQSKGYSEKADMWSLGITALELAKSYAPYARERTMKVLLRTLQEDPPSLDTYSEYDDKGKTSKAFSSSFHRFYKRLLQKEPKKRPSAKDLLKDRFLTQTKDPKAVLKSKLLPFLRKLGPVASNSTDNSAETSDAAATDNTSGVPNTLPSQILDPKICGKWVDPSKEGEDKTFTTAQKAMEGGETGKAKSKKFMKSFNDAGDDDEHADDGDHEDKPDKTEKDTEKTVPTDHETDDKVSKMIKGGFEDSGSEEED